MFRFYPSYANYPCRYLATNAQVNAPKPNELNPMITWDSNETSERNNSEIILSLLQFFVTKIFDSLIIFYYNYLSFFCAIILVIFSMAQKTLQHPKPLECTQQNSITPWMRSFLQTHDNKKTYSAHIAHKCTNTSLLFCMSCTLTYSCFPWKAISPVNKFGQGNPMKLNRLPSVPPRALVN